MSQLDTKEKILDAAFELFTSKSFGNVTVDEIAQNVKPYPLSKGALFHHFKSKDDIGLEALVHGFSRVYKGVFISNFDIEAPPEEKLKRLIQFTFNFYNEKPKLIRYMIEMYEVASKKQTPEQIHEWMVPFTETVKIFQDIFEECDIPNPELRAYLMGACLDGIAFLLLMKSEGVADLDVQALQEETYKIFMKK